MPQRWDQNGNPVPDKGTTGPVQRWDATGNPVGGTATAGDAQGTKGGGGAPQPTMEQLSPSTKQPSPVNMGGMAREGALGLASGLTGLPESTSPLKTASESMEKGSLGYQLGSAVGGHQPLSYTDLVKQHNPLTSAIDTAKGLYGAGKEIATAPDVEGIAHGTGSFVGQLLQLSSLMKGGDRVVTPEVSSAARLVERHAAINQGQVKIVNSMVRNPINMLEGKVSVEIGKHVDAVLAADELHNQVTNNPAGYVDAVTAAGEAAKKSEKIGGEFAPRVGKLIERASAGPMTMRDAKALTTDVGRESASMSRTGKAREAAVLTELYDNLHQATASRADDLGNAYAKSWQHYINESASMRQMQGGVMGDLMNEPNHAKVLDRLGDPDNAAAVKEITAKMKQYGVDPAPFQRGQQMGMDLNNLSNETKNAFVGKIRSIMKYPYAAGSGAAAASFVGHLSRIPGMSFVLPLIVAGKIGGMLDQASIRTILKEVSKAVPSGEVPSPVPGGRPTYPSNVYRPGEGPQPTPAPPSAAGITAPPTKGATPGEAADMGDAQQAEEERQLMARKLSRTRKAKGASK